MLLKRANYKQLHYFRFPKSFAEIHRGINKTNKKINQHPVEHYSASSSTVSSVLLFTLLC